MPQVRLPCTLLWPRTGHGPAHMAVVKHMAVNLLRQARPTVSLKNRRKRAGWNIAYLESLIRQTA